MKRLMIYALTLWASAAWAFSPSIWPLTVNTNVDFWTNAIGNELITNTIDRSCSIGITNWALLNAITVYDETTNATTTRGFTNITVTTSNGIVTTNTAVTSRTFTVSYPVFTNIVVTNYYGPFVQEGFTGVVAVTAESLEQITDQIEAIIPSFSLPFYTIDPDYSFDGWFKKKDIQSGTTNYPADFPMASKADAFHKIPLGGLLGSADGTTYDLTFVPVPANATNQWGQVTNGIGYWTKRKDRVNQLIVAQWGPERSTYLEDTNVWWGWWHNGPYAGYPGYNLNTYPALGTRIETYREWDAAGSEYAIRPSWESEFIQGDSRLIDLPETNYPTYIWIPGGTNAFKPLTMTISSGWYGIGGHPGCFVASNKLYSGETIIGETEQLTSATQRAARAWTSLRAEMLGTPADMRIGIRTNIESGVTNVIVFTNGGGHVQLVWTNKLTTYEGTKVWDNVLLPEQLDEHYGLLTNLFLVPVDISGWTNGAGYNTTNILVWSNMVTNASAGSYVTNIDSLDMLVGGVTSSCPQDTDITETWYRHPPIIPPKWMSNETVFVSADRTVSAYTNGLQDAPSYSYSTSVKIDLHEWANFLASINPPIPPTHGELTNTTVWSWSAYRDDTAGATSIEYAVASAPIISGIWTGAEHRAHFYTRADPIGENNPYYARLSNGITAWTYDPVIVGPTIDLRGSLTNHVYTTTNSTATGCQDETASVYWREFPLESTNTILTLMGWTATNVWHTNTVTVITNYYSCGETNLEVTDVSDSNPDAWGTYTFVPGATPPLWGTNTLGWFWGWNGDQYIVWTPDMGSGYNLGATIPADSYAHGPDPATGTIHAAYYSLPTGYTNYCTNITWIASNESVAVILASSTNTIDIIGWEQWRFATLEDCDPLGVTNVGDHIPTGVYSTNYTMQTITLGEAINSSGGGPVQSCQSETNYTNITSTAYPSPCTGDLVTATDYYSNSAWCSSNYYVVGSVPTTSGTNDVCEAEFFDSLVGATAWWETIIFEEPDWKFVYRDENYPPETTFTLAKPCDGESVVRVRSSFDNRQTATTNITRSVGVEIKAIMEWRYP